MTRCGLCLIVGFDIPDLPDTSHGTLRHFSSLPWSACITQIWRSHSRQQLNRRCRVAVLMFIKTTPLLVQSNYPCDTPLETTYQSISASSPLFFAICPSQRFKVFWQKTVISTLDWVIVEHDIATATMQFCAPLIYSPAATCVYTTFSSITKVKP